MLVAFVAIGMLALAFAGIAIKILVKKDGQFSGTCASNNPLLREEGAACGVCGARPDEQCKSE
ncbi:MAG: membrane or secreted protein [Cryomorphaceae bacterium]|nr:MAG: membrane or secreted protein [Cryomorphaceae bacterium]